MFISCGISRYFFRRSAQEFWAIIRRSLNGYQLSFSVVQESMAKFIHLRPEEKRLHYALERPGSAFHRPVTYPTLPMPRFQWC